MGWYEVPFILHSPPLSGAATDLPFLQGVRREPGSLLLWTRSPWAHQNNEELRVSSRHLSLPEASTA